MAPLRANPSFVARVVPGAPHAAAGGKVFVTRVRIDRCLFGTMSNLIDTFARIARWLISHGTLDDVLLETSGFSASLGTVYAVSTSEWLRQASLAPATPEWQFRKFVLKRLDGEARS